MIVALGHIARQEGIQVTDQEMWNEMLQFSKTSQVNLQDLLKKNGRVQKSFAISVDLVDFFDLAKADSSWLIESRCSNKALSSHIII